MNFFFFNKRNVAKMINFGDDDIVVSGIAGRFPMSRNLNEFADNLYNKVNMVDDDNSDRWGNVSDDLNYKFGKVSDLDKFDASFFSTLSSYSKWMDPQGRILIEHAYEAILDAGISPQSLRGSETGVFIGLNLNDAFNIYAGKYCAHNNALFS